MNKVEILTKQQNMRKYQIEITELKDKITELKNTIQKFNSRLIKAEGNISELKKEQ